MSIAHLWVHLKIFMVKSSVGKLMSKSNLNFSLLSSFQVKFDRVINELGGQK